MNQSNIKFLALGGITGPILFTLSTIISASLRPDYSHVSQFISELGATGTSNAQLMNFAGFLPTGLMIAALGVSLFFLLLPKRPVSSIGSALIAIFGLGAFFSGIFSILPKQTKCGLCYCSINTDSNQLK